MIKHQPTNSLGNYNYNSYIYRGIRWKPHFHKNFELIYLLEGEMTAVIGGRTYSLKQGQAAIVLSNQIHSFNIPENSSAIVTVFSEEYVPMFASYIKGREGDTAVFKMSGAVVSLFKEKIIYGESAVFMKKACFYAICDEYLSNVVLKERKDSDESSIVKILDWIACHYTENISLKEISLLFGYEYHYLSRLLNKTYDITFNQLVNGYRVEKAMELLLETELPITEVVSKSGFQSIRNFNLVFKETVGKNPKDFRRQRYRHAEMLLSLSETEK